MKYTESDCVNCGLPCLYEACPHFQVTRYMCDGCKEEGVTLYEFGGIELCIDCIKQQLIVVDGSDVYDY